jgi:hypothetical protein
MENVEFLVDMSGGLILVVLLGWVIGHLLKLNKFSEDHDKGQQIHLRKTDISKMEPGD